MFLCNRGCNAIVVLLYFFYVNNMNVDNSHKKNPFHVFNPKKPGSPFSSTSISLRYMHHSEIDFSALE
ncbi:hypothetical protein KFK09_002677 [Dendrobium nobile]|uniref:Uncharacterized protein n=1 Tax=Dendrobium nobile TaxID=94219 RepID=A0A8T3C4H8_DENNO|nr:hypothetical protein KFK09_002677 [Dendrobium nobile]